ncbi:MAG: c-type cytochrome domain-containing protein, partial [Planctomycetaceae bacterium]
MTSSTLRADDAAENLEFFEKRVRPVLVEVCQKCHGANRQESGLRLDSRESLLKGGDRGAALELQNLPASRLLEVIGYEGDLRMPPKGKLPADQIAAIAEWV